jgi:hypothetical protein
MPIVSHLPSQSQAPSRAKVIQLGVTGVIEGKFTVSYNWLFIKQLRWPLTRRDTTGFAAQHGYISLGV